MLTPISPSGNAFLFDVDGTLADTEELHAEAYHRAIVELSGHAPHMASYVDSVGRQGQRPLDFLRSCGVTLDARRLADAKARHYRQLARHSLHLRAGAEELISDLQRYGFSIGLVSSSSAASVSVLLDTCWPGPDPSVVITRGQTSGGKPAAAPFLKASARLGTQPDQCFVFENSPRGAQSARAAGVGCVILLEGLFQRNELGVGELVVPDFRAVAIVGDSNSLALAVDA